MTDAVRPAITFIPTIIFNGVYNETLQDGAINNFLKTACGLLNYMPKACNKFIRTNIDVIMIKN